AMTSLSLHDALPISIMAMKGDGCKPPPQGSARIAANENAAGKNPAAHDSEEMWEGLLISAARDIHRGRICRSARCAPCGWTARRSEEHTSELQSREN